MERSAPDTCGRTTVTRSRKIIHAHDRSRLCRAGLARGTGCLHRRPAGLLRGRGRPRRAARRLHLGRGAAAPLRHHRARPGTVVPADRWHSLGRTRCQHPPPAVLVPRPPRSVRLGRPGRPTTGGTRAPHRTRVLRPDHAASGRSRPGPRHPHRCPPARRLRHGPAPAARRHDRRRPGRQHHGTGGDRRRAWLAGAGLGRRPLPDPHRGRGRRPHLHPPGRPRGPGRRTSPPTRPAGDPQRPRHHGAAKTFLGQHTEDEARAHYETFIAPYFTTDGQADLVVGATAITAVAAELGVPVTVTAGEFYRTATTTP